MKFKKFIESRDIFGFEPKVSDAGGDGMFEKPIHQFDLELMMEYLSHKSIGANEPYSKFMNEINWGSLPGSIKLEVDTGYTFYIKKLGIDRQGSPKWVTKKMFQLNRQGYGGMEDAIAQEIYQKLETASEGAYDGPQEGFSDDDLKSLVLHLYEKSKHVMKNIFVPMGIKKLQENAYVFSMEVRGGGCETQGQRRIEQNQTTVTYDKSQGTIRVFNYNVESPVGGPHKWEIMENDIDLYFFPSQSREEISDCLAVHFKYY